MLPVAAKSFFTCAVCAACCAGQGTAAAPGIFSQGQVPLYEVTVVADGLDAVAYQYRSGPTKIGFRGTVLLPEAKGEASVRSRQGRTEIEAKFVNLAPPSRFGGKYLTYVLWAVSPEGSARNLGEIVPDSSNRGKLRTSTDSSTFAMFVTAEPYAAVRQPGNVVTLENRVRPDTMGNVVPVRIQSELMPRQKYTWQMPSQPETASAGPKVSMSQYQALLELYQAQNAVALARAANAGRYAVDAFTRATRALSQAQRLESAKAQANLVIQNAREAAQAADDARTVAERRQQAIGTGVSRAIPPQPAAATGARDEANREAIETPLRAALHRRLNGTLLNADTPAGVVIILPDTAFDGSNLLTSVSEKLGPVASTLLSKPGVRVQVEGYTDSGELQSWERAQAVRNLLVGAGLPGNQVSVRGGAVAPAGRQDRRVQIVISGGQ